MENSKTACYPKILVTSCLQEVALYERFQLEGLTWNILVFWMLSRRLGEFAHVQCPCDES